MEKRLFRPLQVLRKAEIGPDVYRVVLTMPSEWRFELNRPGGFIIVKPSGADHYSAAPMAIYQSSEDETMSLVFEVKGPKTKKLAQSGAVWDVKGPFCSGLWGARRLQTPQNLRCLVVAAGTGQSLLPAVVRQLLKMDNDLHLVVEAKNNGMVYAVEDLAGLDRRDSALSMQLLMPRSDKPAGSPLADAVREHCYDVLVSLGSDYLHEQVARLRDDQPWAASNNSVMVCGEGICGSCGVVLDNGEHLRGCKVDIPPEFVFGSPGVDSEFEGGPVL